VYQLLGGKQRDRISVYFWLGGDRPAETAAQAEALATKLRDAGVPAEVVRAADKNRLTLNRELGAAGDEPTNKILA
jgi:L-alanine-DL-glutamate epimerase-like enolase superfamily enzyme